MIRKFLLLFCIFSIFQANAQISYRAAKRNYKQGVSLYKNKKYKEALEYFTQAEEAYSDIGLFNSYTGVSYFEINEAAKAIPYLEKAKLMVEDRNIYLYLGKSYHLTHDFDKAISSLQLYHKKLKDTERAEQAEYEKYMNFCQNGIDLKNNAIEVEIVNLGDHVNSSFPEYHPVVSADESTLIFTSRRSDSKGGKLDPKDLRFYEDIYIASKDSNTWSKPVGIGNKINTDNHDACIALSADGQQMLIYRAHSGGGDIYLSTLEGTIWTSPKNLGPNINSPAWESSGSISADNNVIFFTSNKKGGIGGTDVYMSRRLENGEFGPAVLLGPQVNTPEDEISPFIHADGKTLYFSSRSHLSMGGFDIFSVKIDMETGELLSSPENIGFPISTAGDDFNFSWSADNSRAYFSSLRQEGKGEHDIYMLERNIALTPLIVWKGTVRDCITQLAIDAEIIVSDNATGKIVGKYKPNSSSGKYTIILHAGRNYNIAVESENYAFHSENINIPTLDSYKEIEAEICLNPIVKGTTITLRNIFFDFDKATLRPESRLELERLHVFLENYSEIRIEIAGHTDSEGGEEYNDKLSQRRAESVYAYLIKKGVNKKRLITKGYGQTRPVATNETIEGRQLNRRTEITIIE